MKKIKSGWLMMLSFLMLSGVAQGQAEPPSYVGTQAQFRDYLAKEMVYPPEAREVKADAEVKVEFVVMQNGSVVNAQATGSGAAMFGREAVRLVRRALWNPGRNGGNEVAMATSVQIPFSWRRYQRAVKRRGYDFHRLDSLEVDTSVVVYETRQTDSPASPLMKPGVKLTELLSRNLHYPEAARKQSIAGKVKVRFVVEPSGYAAHFRVEQHVPGGCSEEALRLLEEMHWTPATKAGKAVRSWYFMSFGFGASGGDFQYFPANQGGSSMN